MLVSPSIISSKLENLGNQITECDRAGVFSYHLDVMDGHFVPNLTMGPDLVRAVRRCTKKTIETHLMIERPDKFYKPFIEAGSDILLVHHECLVDLRKLISGIRDENAKFGLVINPETPFEKVRDLIDEAEILLIMSIHPGFSGQKFMDSVLPKIAEAKKYIKDQGLSTKIEIDGGVNDETGKKCADAGADILVSASYIFSGKIGERINKLQVL
ncbi:MAG: ribulose-phosphate 3-epimerase [Candidatus Thermoplasmatota archaeon]|nr:ribulose-phosphate 3-epimerase [Candidatus Thermoplasmatota archaeon]